MNTLPVFVGQDQRNVWLGSGLTEHSLNLELNLLFADSAHICVDGKVMVLIGACALWTAKEHCLASLMQFLWGDVSVGNQQKVGSMVCVPVMCQLSTDGIFWCL